MFYALEPLISGIILTNLLQFCYVKVSRKPKTGSHWQKWGPVWLVFLATVFTMAQPMAVLFIYVGEIGYPEHKLWTNGWFPSTPLGVTLYVLKWLGVVLLIVGVFQVTQIHQKIKKKWQAIRSAQQGKKVSDESEGAAATAQPAEEECAT